MPKMYFGFTFFVLAVLIIAGCNAGNPGAGQSSSNPRFDSFKMIFKPMDLPIAIKGCYIEPAKFTELPISKYPGFVTDSDNEYSFCTFKANGDYTAIITLGPADCFFPILTTYDKEGKVIDKKNVVIGKCGADCGFTCEEYMTISADYSLYTSDTLTTFKCDTTGNVIPNTKEHYVVYKKGKLLSSGKIELSDEITEPLKD
jgi:hypothetical protein